jgi:hypothetical protein
MRHLLIILGVIACTWLLGCENLPAEKIPDIPEKLQPVPFVKTYVRHIEGHKILFGDYDNGRGGQLFIIDLGKVEDTQP